MDHSRTALTVRCSQEDAKALRVQALAEHRSISGCMLNVLERHLWIEERYIRGLSDTFIEDTTREFRLNHRRGDRTRMLLRCSEQQARRIRMGARKRRMSISEFVVFCIRRHWEARFQAPGQGTPRIGPL